jgi:hypothetical protein
MDEGFSRQRFGVRPTCLRMMRGRVRMIEAGVLKHSQTNTKVSCQNPVSQSSQLLKVFGRPITTAIRTQRSICDSGLNADIGPSQKNGAPIGRRFCSFDGKGY